MTFLITHGAILIQIVHGAPHSAEVCHGWDCAPRFALVPRSTLGQHLGGLHAATALVGMNTAIPLPLVPGGLQYTYFVPLCYRACSA